MGHSSLHAPVLGWFRTHQRDLPWRRPGTSAWAVLVSEVMLQQTPVERVLPVHADWLARWPRPADLAAASPGDALRVWGRLGYPRRALRLHEAAGGICKRHGGQVPSSYEALLELPGVGPYTAAAVASFAYGGRHAVLDTNVRRVLARALAGQERPAPQVTAGERAVAEAVVPDEPADAARWAAAVMELGALVCSAREPRCADCPIRSECAWRVAGRPPYAGRRRPPQAFTGTDRQVRGRLLSVLQDRTPMAGPIAAAELESVWSDADQRNRALAGLLADGLVVDAGDGRLSLPR